MALKATATTDSTTATELRADVLKHLDERLHAEEQKLRDKRRKKPSDYVTEGRIEMAREVRAFWTNCLVEGKPAAASAEADDIEWTDEELAEPAPFAEGPAAPEVAAAPEAPVAPPAAPAPVAPTATPAPVAPTATPALPIGGGQPARSAAAAPQID